MTKKNVEAKRMGSTLVVAFHRANPPLIWRFDLERNHSFTLALQGEEGDWELGVTSPKGEFYTITRFLAREDAEEAFRITQKTLMKKRCRWLKVFGVILAVLLLVLTALYLVGRLSGSGLPSESQGSSPVEMQGGIPLPADQVLTPPR